VTGREEVARPGGAHRGDGVESRTDLGVLELESRLRQHAGNRPPALHVAPENAEWAQAVVTEEIVDLLDQDGLPLDLEIAEGWLFLYRPGRLSVPDPLVWRRVFGILDALDVSLSAAAGSLPGPGPFPALPMREQVAQTTRHATAKYFAVVGGLFVVLAGGAYLLFGR